MLGKHCWGSSHTQDTLAAGLSVLLILVNKIISTWRRTYRDLLEHVRLMLRTDDRHDITGETPAGL